MLGDGSEVLTDSDNAADFDPEDEDKDLESQVRQKDDIDDDDVGAKGRERTQREDTPGPLSPLDAAHGGDGSAHEQTQIYSTPEKSLSPSVPETSTADPEHASTGGAAAATATPTKD